MSLDSTNWIYGLIDPRTKLVRYIGKTACGMFRPLQHAYRTVRTNTYCGRWLRQLATLDLEYEITILEQLPSENALNAAEIWWIAYGRALGWPLTNLTSGGTGASTGAANVAKRPEVRAKISKASSGRTHSESAKQLMRAARLGKPGPIMSPTGIEAIRQAHLGKIVSDDTRQLISAANTGKRRTDEAKAKMSVARTGDANVSKRPEVRQKISDSNKASPKVRAHLEELWDAKRVKYVPCGTQLGYARANLAERAGQPNCGPCVDCKRAAADYAKSRRVKKPRVLAACGTVAGYDRAIDRRRRRVANCGPCQACAAARRAYDKARGK